MDESTQGAEGGRELPLRAESLRLVSLSSAAGSAEEAESSGPQLSGVGGAGSGSGAGDDGPSAEGGWELPLRVEVR
jgi:hypothetical protein